MFFILSTFDQPDKAQFLTKLKKFCRWGSVSSEFDSIIFDKFLIILDEISPMDKYEQTRFPTEMHTS